MAVTDSYATVQVYRDVVSKSDTGNDGAIEDALRAVSRWIDRRVGRFFTQDGTVRQRIYVVPGSLRSPYAAPPLGWAESENPWRYGIYSRVLEVDDISVTNGFQIIADENNDGLFTEAPWATTDYELWPINADKGPVASPWTSIAI